MLKLLVGENSVTLVFSGLLNGLEQFKKNPNPYVNDAIGTAQITDAITGAAIGGQMSWVYIAGSNGDYYAQVPTSLGLTIGALYKIVVRITSPTGLELEGPYDAIAEARAA